MNAGLVSEGRSHRLMGRDELPPSVPYAETEMELWPYRRRTVALLRRCAQASVEVGKIPAVLGREFFGTRVISCTMRSFEYVVIFVADIEKALEGLGGLGKKTAVERSLQNAFDQLSEIPLD